MKRVQDFHLLYWILVPYVKFTTRLFYGKIRIDGVDHLPKNQPFIIAPNHQNALMDALVVLAGIRQPVVFLARSDIFKNKRIAAILHFLKIMPVYRIRDGYGQLGKNDDTFLRSVDVLRDGLPLCLMPEGAQSGKRSLLPLVKGMFRIAFMAQEQIPEKEVMIIPTGIDYQDYIHPGGNLILRFGPPVPLASYMHIYRENPVLALNTIREEVSGKISALIQDIRSPKYYDEFYAISKMAGLGQDLSAGLQTRQHISMCLDQLEEKAPTEAEALSNLYKQYRALLEDLRVEDRHIACNPSLLETSIRTLFLIATAPLFVCGYLGNLLPALCTRLLLKKVKDIGFYSSFSYVAQLVLYTLYYSLLFLGLLFFIPWRWFIVFPLLPVLGYFAFFYLRQVKRTSGQWRCFRLRSSEKRKKAQHLRSTILGSIPC